MIYSVICKGGKTCMNNIGRTYCTVVLVLAVLIAFVVHVYFVLFTLWILYLWSWLLYFDLPQVFLLESTLFIRKAKCLLLNQTYSIFQFLDAQRIHNLTAYLQVSKTVHCVWQEQYSPPLLLNTLPTNLLLNSYVYFQICRYNSA